ncbi:SPW repeat protein [Leisingera sp.]|uniref:SPW repeat protein n=1 Tax=Leisingera sp. TaxID=1879318 RepID=UPI002B2740B2|nr:SPW repeat protein [Leisingera sp.]
MAAGLAALAIAGIDRNRHELLEANTVFLLGVLLFVSPELAGFKGTPAAVWNAVASGAILVLGASCELYLHWPDSKA